MPVAITFHKVSEKKPEHGQSIIWLQNTTSFGYQGFNPREVDVEYQWTEYFLDNNNNKVQLPRLQEKHGSHIFFDIFLILMHLQCMVVQMGRDRYHQRIHLNY